MDYSLKREQEYRRTNSYASYAAALAEACWLGAVVTIPLAVQLMAERPYSDPKIALVGFYGMFMWGCLAIALSDLWLRIRKLQLVVALSVGLLAVAAISQNFAFDPAGSTHHRDVASFRLAALAPQIGLFLGVCAFLRTSEQLRRLASVMVLTGFAVAFVALAETWGFSNPDHGENPPWTIASFLGSGLSVGGYLIVCIPLSVWWLWHELQRVGSRINLAVILAAAILVFQLSAILGANKRGPLVSLLVAGVVAVVLLHSKQSAPRKAVRVLILGGAIFGALTALALHGQREPNFRDTPVLGKLSMIVPVGDGTGDSSRAEIWRVARDIFTRHIPVEHPDGQADKFALLRPWLGLGPDNAVLALASGYLMLGRWPSTVLEMSTHNHFLDVLLTLGVVGLVVAGTLYASIFSSGLGYLYVRTMNTPKAYLLGLLTLVLVAAGVTVVWGSEYCIAGIQAGILTSLMFQALLARHRVQSTRQGDDTYKLLTAFLVAVSGYWAFLWFMYPTSGGLAVFLILGGAIVGFSKTESCPTGPRQAHNLQCIKLPAGFWSHYIVVLLLLSVVNSRYSIFPILTGTAAPYALFTESVTNTIVVCSLILAILATASLLCSDSSNRRRATMIAVKVAAPVMIGVLFLLVLLSVIAPRVPLQWTADVAAGQVLLVPLVGLAAAGTFAATRLLPISATGIRSVTLLCAAFCGGGIALVLGDIRASTAGGFAKRLTLPYNHPLASRMVELAPERMDYRKLGVLLVEGQLRGSPPYSPHWLKLEDAKLQMLEEMHQRSSYGLHTAQLARAYLQRRDMTQGDAERDKYLMRAESLLQETLKFMPKNEPALVDLAFVHGTKGENVASTNCLIEADRVVSSSSSSPKNISYLRWWTYYYNLAANTDEDQRRTLYATRALKYLNLHLYRAKQTLNLPSADSSAKDSHLQQIGWIYSARGDMWLLLGRPDKASSDFALSGYFWAFKPTLESMATLLRRSARPLGERLPRSSDLHRMIY